jgi:hypothetical protein
MTSSRTHPSSSSTASRRNDRVGLASRRETTRGSAARLDAEWVCAEQRKIVEAIKTHGGLTDEQIQDLLRMPPNSQRPRRKELERRGVIRDSGRRRPTRSGRAAIVWAISMLGPQAGSSSQVAGGQAGDAQRALSRPRRVAVDFRDWVLLPDVDGRMGWEDPSLCEADRWWQQQRFENLPVRAPLEDENEPAQRAGDDGDENENQRQLFGK